MSALVKNLDGSVITQYQFPEFPKTIIEAESPEAAMIQSAEGFSRFDAVHGAFVGGGDTVPVVQSVVLQDFATVIAPTV